ncbi:MAG: hypothetical protein BWX66_01717 [Deltaproteobacteria bacterium ADurb.Bin058]|nr:MAG: hypothetical protein BWX66_01717 [Deltaproteobacteria bacterium ADurb.Bin058]
MTLNLTELEAVVADMQKVLIGSTFLDFRQLDEFNGIMALQTANGIKNIRFSASLRLSRIHFTKSRPPAAKGPTGYAFEGKMFRELKEMRLKEIKTAFGDRVVIMRFSNDSYDRKLIFECSGHHPNLFLTDEHEEVIGLLVPSHSKKRLLKIGRRYTKPLAREKAITEAFRFAPGSGKGDLSARIEAAYKELEAKEASVLKAVEVRNGLAELLERIKRTNQQLRERGQDVQSALEHAAKVELALRAVLEGQPNAVEQGEKILEAERAKKVERPKARHRRFETRSGLPILVAADEQDNQVLLFETAKDDDLWFQVESGAGAHVILQNARKDLPFEELLDAALLAVFFSKEHESREAPVLCTHKRNIRLDQKGRQLGSIRLLRTQTFKIRPDPVRMKRLLSSEKGARA